MARHFTSENLRALGSAAVLVRNTVWKCGRVEKLIIRHLQHSARKTEKACKTPTWFATSAWKAEPAANF